MKAGDLIGNHSRAWEGATRHPFLEGVRDGTLPEGAFERWLVQDRMFVEEELGLLRRLLPGAPRRDQNLFESGIAALEEELGWFEEQARRRNLTLSARPERATESYLRFLRALADEPYPAALTALWAIERAYLEAWRNASPGACEYREFVEHWSTPEFAAFVASLEEAADRALATGEADERADALFLEVADLERRFWEMALGEGRSG